MKKILEYLPLLSICFIYFGFCNLYYYFKEFNIAIYSFVSTTDILLSFLPRIVVFSSIIYGNVLQKLFETIDDKKPNTLTDDQSLRKRNRIAWWRKYIYYIIVGFYILSALTIYFLQSLFKMKSYELTDWSLTFDLVFILLIYIAFLIHARREQLVNNPILIALFLIVFIGQRIGNYRMNEARKLRDGIYAQKGGRYIFDYSGKSISTSDSLLYIGQTSTHLFLYCTVDSSTQVFKMDNIEKLIVR